jgi:hypothetical protein
MTILRAERARPRPLRAENIANTDENVAMPTPDEDQEERDRTTDSRPLSYTIAVDLAGADLALADRP